MGQETTISTGDSLRAKRTIRVNLFSMEPGYTTITLVRNGVDLDTRRWNEETPVIEFEDLESLDGIAIREAPFHPKPFVAYYVRVENRFDQTQWSSPIWLDLA